VFKPGNTEIADHIAMLRGATPSLSGPPMIIEPTTDEPPPPPPSFESLPTMEQLAAGLHTTPVPSLAPDTPTQYGVGVPSVPPARVERANAILLDERLLRLDRLLVELTEREYERIMRIAVAAANRQMRERHGTQRRKKKKASRFANMSNLYVEETFDEHEPVRVVSREAEDGEDVAAEP